MTVLHKDFFSLYLTVKALKVFLSFSSAVIDKLS